VGQPSPLTSPAIIQERVTTTTTNLANISKAADIDLSAASYNLCIAQQLRNLAPGSSAGPALLFSEADQRELLEIIRERTQIAMLQYALLGETFVVDPLQFPPSAQANQELLSLTSWVRVGGTATNQSGESLRHAMGDNLAAAVQLHITVTQELAALFSRNRSARTPRGATPPSAAEDLWGPASWYQRAMALMFGGDPLAIDPTLGAWTPIALQAQPGTAITGGSWPTIPHANTQVDNPLVYQLLALAKRYDALTLDAQPATQNCAGFFVNTGASAQTLYNTVEAHLRKDECFPFTPGVPCSTTLPTTVNPPFLLETEYGITRDHANTLVGLLSDELTLSPSTPGACPLMTGDVDVTGADPNGTVAFTNPMGSSGTIHLSAKGNVASRTLEELAAQWTALAPIRFGEPFEFPITIGADMTPFGFRGGHLPNFQAIDRAAEAERILGATSALAATREMIMSALDQLAPGVSTVLPEPNAITNDYYAHAPSIMAAIGGAIGPTSVTAVPTLQDAGFSWQIRVTHPAEDTYYDDIPDVGLAGAEGPYAYNLAAHPETTIFGETLQSVIAGEVFGDATLAQTEKSAPIAGEWRWRSQPVSLVGLNETGQYVSNPTTLVAAGPAGPTRLLVALVSAAPPDSSSADLVGQYFAFGGTLGSWMTHQAMLDTYNPVQPAYDGFDLPTRWVPPLNAQILGGQPGQTSASFYLNLATTAASNAATAAQAALSTLIMEESDQAALQAATAKSQLEIAQDQQALCGFNPPPNCRQLPVLTTLSAIAANQSNFPSESTDYPDCDPNNPNDPDQTTCQLKHAVNQLINAMLGAQVDVAAPVMQAIGAPSQPAFQDFAGGTLQGLYITQWNYLAQLPSTAEALIKNRDAMLDAYQAANLTLMSDKQYWDAKCSPVNSALAFVNDVVVPVVEAVGSAGADTLGAINGINNFSNFLKNCDGALTALETDEEKIAQATDDAFAAMASAANQFFQLEGSIAKSGADILAAQNQAQMADTKAQLETQLAAETQQTSFGLYRRYHDYDLWQAKALTENARVMALAARRAIEAQYVVNLSELTSKEAFVQSPASWADTIYGYDLNLASSLGLIVGMATPGGINVNAITNYVTNLQNFVTGFAVSRPSAVAQNQIDVVTLPGLSASTPVTINGITAFPNIGTWSLHCSGGATPGGTWVRVPSDPTTVDTACLPVGGPQSSHPDLASLDFSLDPWGRVSGGTGAPPVTKEYNSRWTQLAVNFVGTGIKNCAVAVDPQGCYASQWIPYNLTSNGPAWVTDYGQLWRFLDVPTGQIELAKGLAAELWLDPLQDGWSTPFIAGVARSELDQRPLGSSYNLLVTVGPEVTLANIQRIQLLVGSNAWVKQQQ
jgi:hypothetical protein